MKVEGEKAGLGQAVAAGDVITTGANSFVTLALSDGSRVTLPSQSRIRIEALDRIALDGRLERRFRLENGRGEFNVAPRQHPEDRFLVRTPVAVAAVRGTEFDIDTDGRDSIITVDEGVVSSRSADDDTETLLPAGRAALLDADDQRQVAMLPRPVLTPQSRVGRGDDTLDLVIAPDAAPAHHVVLAHDAGFVDQYRRSRDDARTASALPMSPMASSMPASAASMPKASPALPPIMPPCAAMRRRCGPPASAGSAPKPATAAMT